MYLLPVNGTQGGSETATAQETSTPPRRDNSANPTQFPLHQQHILLVFDCIVRVVMKETAPFPNAPTGPLSVDVCWQFWAIRMALPS